MTLPVKLLATDGSPPLNTHAINLTGVVLAVTGILVPPLLGVWFPNMPTPLATAIHDAGRVVALIGIAGAAQGRPLNVPQK